jgi:hypothetical protein
VDLDVVFLGTSGSTPTAQRAPAATLVRRGGERLLVDCAEGTQRQLLRSSVGLPDLEDIFLTHYHADHYLGLPGLLKTFSLRGREAPLAIHGPPGLAAFLVRHLDEVEVARNDRMREDLARLAGEVRAEVARRDVGQRQHPHLGVVRHLCSLPGGRVEGLGCACGLVVGERRLVDEQVRPVRQRADDLRGGGVAGIDDRPPRPRGPRPARAGTAACRSLAGTRRTGRGGPVARRSRAAPRARAAQTSSAFPGGRGSGRRGSG